MLPHRLSPPRPALLFACLLVLFTLLSTAAAPLPQTDAPPDAIPVELRDKVQSMRERYTHWQEPPASLLPAMEPEAGEPGAAPLPDPSAVTVSDTDIWDRVVYQYYINNNWEIGYSSQINTNPINILASHPSSDVRPHMTSDGERIVFASNRDGQYEIYLTTKDNAKTLRLTAHSATDTMPAWSPTGDRIVFVSDRSGSPEIYVMNSDGSNLRQLTDNHGTNINPIWSPDGTRIAWVQLAEDFGVIAMMYADGTNQHIITGHLPYLYGLAWSRDSKMLAFDYDANSDYWFDIGVVGADGSGLHAVNMGTTKEDLGVGSWNQPAGYINCYTTYYYFHTEYGYVVQYALLNACFTDGKKETTYPYTYGSGIYWFPDAYNTDPYPPSTWINTLPLYSKLTDTFIIHGTDTGPSGVTGAYIYVQRPNSTKWEWIGNGWVPLEAPLKFANLPIGLNKFQTKGYDNANNAEPAKSVPDASTTLYRYNVTNLVLDSREMPLTGAAATFNPAILNNPVSDTQGRIDGYLANGGSFMVKFSSSGFAELVNIPVSLTRDTSLPDVILSPADNLIKNGSFESSSGVFNDWTLSGTLSGASSAGFLDANAARLGPDAATCPKEPCFESTQQVTLPKQEYNLFYDKTGTIHVFSGSKHFFRSTPSSSWASENFTSMPYLNFEHAYADSQNTLNVIFSNGNQVFYTYKRAADTEWATPENVIGVSTPVRSAVDTNGRIHVIGKKAGASDTRIGYVNRLGPGSWSAYQELTTYAQAYDIIANPAGGVMILYADKTGTSEVLMAQPVSSQGVFGASERAFTHQRTNYIYNLVTQYDAAGHLFVADRYGMFITRNPDGIWDTHDPFTDTTSKIIQGMAVTLQGRVYLASGPPPYTLFIKDPDSSSFYPAQTNVTGSLLTINLDPDGFLFLAFLPTNTLDLTFASLNNVPAGEQTLSQTIALPASIHEPTLSFHYALRSEVRNSQSHTKVMVTPEGEDPVTVFSSGSNENWTHAWVDLSAYAGKTLTVSFKLTQPEGESAARLHLDDVSVGAWETPVLEGVSPSEAASGPVTLTLTGQNFMEGAAVKVGSTYLTNVVVNSEDELTAELPAGMLAGVYDVTVSNPGGASDSLAKALRFGGWLFMPFAQK